MSDHGLPIGNSHGNKRIANNVHKQYFQCDVNVSLTDAARRSREATLKWKARSGCLEKFALGNSQGSSDFPEGRSPEEKSDDLREFPRANFSDNH